MIFSMTFGAGNVVFPLTTGVWCKSLWFFGFLGFFISSIFLPFLGLFATAMSQGSYKSFLGTTIGKFFAATTTVMAMLLLGPLGCIPRCAILAYETGADYWIGGKIVFSAVFFLVSFLIAMEKHRLINVLGKILAPTSIISFTFLIIKGILKAPAIQTSSGSVIQAIHVGTMNGCFTLDLLAAIFYSRIILVNIESMVQSGDNKIDKEALVKFLLKSGTLAIMFFSFIYGGMIWLSAAFSSNLPSSISPGALFGEIAKVVLPANLAFVQKVFVITACFSTTLALLTVFADYINQTSQEKISYKKALFCSIVVCFVLSITNFSYVLQVMLPMMTFVYPVLIFAVSLVMVRLLSKSLCKKNLS